MDAPDNIDDLASRLASGSLASELVAACKSGATPEVRAEALHKVLRQHLDELVAAGTKHAEVEGT